MLSSFLVLLSAIYTNTFTHSFQPQRLKYVFLWFLFLRIYAVTGESISPYFKTEPKVRQDTVNIIKSSKLSTLSQGLVFLSRNLVGPELFDNDGNLVWSGTSVQDIEALRFNLCKLGGPHRTHLCFHESFKITKTAYHPGYFKFLDDSYSVVAKSGQINSLGAPDGHEVNTPLTCANCLIQAVYRTKKYDVTRNGKTYKAKVLDSCIQDVDLEKKKVTFEWCCLDNIGDSGVDYWFRKHVHNPKKTPHNMEPFHINGIDRNSDGDYLVSLRQIDTVLKIAGNNNAQKPGTVLWRLGTARTFKEDFTFKGQHTCRFINSTSTTETITFFNNARRGPPPKDPAISSAGYLIEINHKRKTAHLVRAYENPSGLSAIGRGSMQILPNGNVFVGWGSEPGYTEFSAEGDVLLDAQLSIVSAHAWKYPWVGRPRTTPKIIAYSFDCKGPLFTYVSWNGATEVTNWRFYTSDSSPKGPWENRGIFTKHGFETKVKLSASFAKYVYAQALSSSGDVLAETPSVQSFVPISRIKGSCTESGCYKPESFTYPAQLSRGGNCDPQSVPDNANSDHKQVDHKSKGGNQTVPTPKPKPIPKPISKSKPKPISKSRPLDYHKVDLTLLLVETLSAVMIIEALTWTTRTLFWTLICNDDIAYFSIHSENLIR